MPGDIGADVLWSGNKFVIIALVDTNTNLTEPSYELTDGTIVLTQTPPELDDTKWREALGTFRWNQLKRASLLFICCITGKTLGLDAKHENLSKQIWRHFHCLQLSGIVASAAAYDLKGAVREGTPVILRFSEAPCFYPSKGYVPPLVDFARIQHAVELSAVLHGMLASGQFGRLLRGLDRLLRGLRQPTGEDRIHEFIRSLEALTFPVKGNTTRLFKSRCQTFAKASSHCDKILGEAYEMRNDVEHLHHWHRALHSYAEAEREHRAFMRTWQMERLSRSAFLRILEKATLREHFKDDDSLEKFWKLPAHERTVIWGEPITL